jgi:hypothetical protein
VGTALRGIRGVQAVTELAAMDGAARYMVDSARDRDVRTEIFQLVAQQKWELRELKRVGMTLEEVFMRIVAGEEQEPAPAVPAVEPPAPEPEPEAELPA